MSSTDWKPYTKSQRDSFNKCLAKNQDENPCGHQCFPDKPLPTTYVSPHHCKDMPIPHCKGTNSTCGANHSQCITDYKTGATKWTCER